MRKFFIVLVSVLFYQIVFAQQPLKHEKKVYHGENGRLYIQKSLPIYLYISTEPNKKGEMHQLQSDSTARFANPMYLDTEGYNTFRSPSAVDPKTKQTYYPLTDIVFEVYADSRTPRTKIYYDAKKKYYDGKVLFIGGELEMKLTSYDAQSGVEKTYISIDSADFVEYKEPIVCNKEKRYKIAYYSVDNVGNAEKVKHRAFTVDLTAPVTELIFKGNKFNDDISGNTKIILKVEDKISGIFATYFSIDGKKYQKYTYALNSKYLTEGEHSIKYYSVDRVGNKEQEHEYKFFVDKTPPILVDEILGNSYVVNGKEYSSGRTKLKLTAVDNKSGIKEIKYSINKEPYALYEKPFYLTTVSGALSVVSYAVDNVGNKSTSSEKSTRSHAAYVDLTGPQLKHTYLGKVFKARDTTYINKDTKIKLLAKDTESGIKSVGYSLNNGDEISYKEPFIIEDEGAYILSIYGYDNVDNSNRETVKLVVDNAGPDIYARFSILPISHREIEGENRDVYSSHVVLFLSATDAKVAIDRIYYSINGGKEQMYTGIVEGFKRGKDYNIEVKAYDKLGNVNTKNIIFGTDNSGPEVFTRFSVSPVSTKEINGKIVDVYPNHVSLFLSVVNTPIAYDRIYYKINGGKEVSYQGIIDGFKSGAVIDMSIRALDRLGNETKKSIDFAIE
jgi:hypothetical protein